MSGHGGGGGGPQQQHEEEPHENHERWLLSYADFITLLLIFFIILYTISKQDAAKFQTMASELNSAFGGSKYVIGKAPGAMPMQGYKNQPTTKPTSNKYTAVGTTAGGENGAAGKAGTAATTGSPGTAGTAGSPGTSTAAGTGAQGTTTGIGTGGSGESKETQLMQQIAGQIQQLAKDKGLSSAMTVQTVERGVVIKIENQVLFGSGQASLNPKARSLLIDVGNVLKVNNQQFMRVEGHTDNVPISTARSPYASNWELSSARAINVVRLFTDAVGIDPKLLSGTGYGEFRPAASNFTNEGRAKNRRVEIVILNSKYNQSEFNGAAVAPNQQQIEPNPQTVPQQPQPLLQQQPPHKTNAPGNGSGHP